jgi:hypothetical protein
MACFNQPPDTGCPELLRSALVTYHFASILLRKSLSDILIAVGTIYSYGCAVTPQRVQDAFPSLESNGTERQGGYHVVEILKLCVDDDDTERAVGTYRAPLCWWSGHMCWV